MTSPTASALDALELEQSPAWLVEYCARMDAAASAFPLDQAGLEALHTKHYDAAYEKMLLSSGATHGDSSQRPVEERIRSKKVRALLTAAKARYIELNDAAGVAVFSKLLCINKKDASPFNEENAKKFLAFVLERSTGSVDSERGLKLAGLALSQCVSKLSSGHEGVDTEALAAGKLEAETSLEGQIRANRLLGSRVEELERENLELHRILDDNTNKALDSWSSGQIKVAKLEEELSTVKADKKNSDSDRDSAKAEVVELENKIVRLKAKMSDFIEDEDHEDKKYVRIENKYHRFFVL
jgi:hypothetical protein